MEEQNTRRSLVVEVKRNRNNSAVQADFINSAEIRNPNAQSNTEVANEMCIQWNFPENQIKCVTIAQSQSGDWFSPSSRHTDWMLVVDVGGSAVYKFQLNSHSYASYMGQDDRVVPFKIKKNKIMYALSYSVSFH